MPHTQNIILVGPMGSGKTTIGRQLAKQLNMAFFDSDHEIEAKTGANIPLIFELEGEKGFRKRETTMLDELTQKNSVVLATGGGAVLAAENRKMLRQRGIVIYLSATTEQLWERTRLDKNRPLLQTGNPREKIDALLEQRDPLYKEIADIVIDTGTGNIKTTIKQIVAQLNNIK
ncbi:Shikimate kinase I [hydrothermal vent metagenome]|uniref:shikimate kinase n=1 Tax=hydrothermal vent metagenome TaxID=652676 RepID=A0A3B1AR25_9ZZZZ